MKAMTVQHPNQERSLSLSLLLVRMSSYNENEDVPLVSLLRRADKLHDAINNSPSPDRKVAQENGTGDDDDTLTISEEMSLDVPYYKEDSGTIGRVFK